MMYSIFLVDDESIIRNGIKQMINWEEYGFSFSGLAQDGEVALPLIKECKPDIVITDIKMPFMDGLELSKKIKKELPNTMIIILSGFDEFEYAKQALSIGVNEYLLKPISKNQFIELLIKVKKELDEKNQKQSQYDKMLNEYLYSARESILNNLLSGRESINEIVEKANKLDINLNAKSYNIVFVTFGDENNIQSDYSEKQNKIYNHFLGYKNTYICKINGDAVAFIIMSDKSNDDDLIVEFISKLRSYIKSIKIEGGYIIKYAESIKQLNKIAENFSEIRKSAYFDRLYTNGMNRNSENKIDFDPNNISANYLGQQIIFKFLSSGTHEDVDEFVLKYFQNIGDTAVNSLLFRQYVALNIQFNINSFIKQISPNNNTYRTEPAQANQLSTLSKTMDYIKSILNYALDIRNKESSGNSTINKAINYINENFTNSEINLNSVAQLVGVNSTYFSSIFSQQVGKTFIEYLTELRMDKARHLLRCTDKASGDIAFEVGYNDPHYFSSLFKKVNGCSPRDYRAKRV